MKWIESVMDIMLPRLCIVCGERLLSSERHLCLECLAGLPLTYFWKLDHNPMSDRFNEVIQKGLDSGNRVGKEFYAYSAALFIYDSEAQFRFIPYHIKYKGDIRAGEYFGRMLGRRLKAEDIWKSADLIIPVPLHWSRKFSRGYNQAEAIASGIASETGIPMRKDILRRIKRTKTQTKLDIDGKARNVADAFKVVKKDLPDARHLVIVDDVFTTGNTLFACFAALRSVFPPSVRISVVTLGYVGGT